MTLQWTLRALGLAGGLALAVVAFGDEPIKLPAITPVGLSAPPPTIPPADAKPVRTGPSVSKVRLTSDALNAADALPKAVADARLAAGKLRDYTGHLIRQERVNGRLLPEQVAELRIRTEPFSVNVKVVSPKANLGEETSYRSAKSETTVRFRMAGTDGVKYGFRSLAIDDPKVLANTRHEVTETGFKAVLERMDHALRTEKRLRHPVQVLRSDYTYAGRPCSRFEVFAERPHPNRYAHRLVLFVDKETKLPVRFEAYDQPRSGAADGELIEAQSFVGIKTNVGLGEAAFDR